MLKDYFVTMLKWCILGIGLLLLSDVTAQKVSHVKKAVEGYDEALLMYKGKRYDEALKILDQVAAYDQFPELYFLKADICNKLKNRKAEILAIEKGLEMDSVRYTGYYFFLAENYMLQGDYEEARFAYEQYLEKDKKQQHAFRAGQQLKNCIFALRALATGKKEKRELFISADKDVYWPSLDVTGKMILYTELDAGIENIRMYSAGRTCALNLNTLNNEGTQSLTADGQMMYFTGCGRADSKGSCDIYVAYRLSDTLWSEPVNLGEPVNTDSWEAQPAISADGRQLFFASNRPGGKGGSDIWYSTLLERYADGRQLWSRPRLLYFNTPGQEMAPFLYYDGKTLFFASDYYPGMGGMDIYKVNLDLADEPLNIGITVNSFEDEMGFVVDACGRQGYFASEREGKRNIYRVLLEDKVKCPEISYLKLDITDEEGGKLVPDQLILQVVGKEDTLAFFNGRYVSSEMSVCVPAESFLLLSVLKAGYLYYSDTLRIGQADYRHPLHRKIVMKKIRENSSFILNGIFFEVDDYTLRPESEPELQHLLAFMRQNPETKIEIAGYTDSVGTDEYNYRLSENRAFEVYKYLFLHRVKKERMTYKGYGKENPLASNDTKEGRAKNRRTEIRVK